MIALVDAPDRARPTDVEQIETQVTRTRLGRVWKSPRSREQLELASRSNHRPSVGGSVAVIATLGLIGAGAFAMSELDDGPVASSVEAAELPAGSLHHLADQIGARQLWERGITGSGVNVALIDTGVAPVAEIADQVVAAVDLSAEAGAEETAFVDGYGHGTHLAGIIAGRSPGARPAASADRPDWFLGVAPDAGIVSVKVAGRDGATSPAAVVAGIDWVVEHREQVGIDVLTIAYDATDADSVSRQAIAAAVERAWHAGIVVVVAAGNEGSTADGLAAPADNPYVIAVGGVEAVDGGFDVAEWSSHGDADRTPDVAAPGAHIRSLRAPGSTADLDHPEGYVDEQLFLGSGSSQSAAVVAGVAALLLEADPDLTPDQVKAALIETAVPVGDVAAVGAGVVSAADAVAVSPSDSVQTWDRTVAPAGPLPGISGVMTVDLDPTSSTWTSSTWTSSTWTSSTWTSSTWTSSTWTSSTWTSSTWT